MQTDTYQTRSFAAVIFRRIATRTTKESTSGENKEIFLQLATNAKVEVRTKLLQSYAAEPNKTVRHKVADAVAEIARQYTDEQIPGVDGQRDTWPDLLQALYQASQSPDADVRESAFRIFEATPGIIEKQHEDIIIQVFQKGIKDDDMKVKIATMKAFSAFFQSLSKKAQPKYYTLIPDILGTLVPVA